MELRGRFDNIYYHADKTECDFVIMTGHGVSHCFQVCRTVEKQDTAEREIEGLLGAMHAYGLKQGTILTNDEHADLERDRKKFSYGRSGILRSVQRKQTSLIADRLLLVSGLLALGSGLWAL